VIIDSHNALIKNGSSSDYYNILQYYSPNCSLGKEKVKELLRLKRAFSLK
jgi:hypothetical protein